MASTPEEIARLQGGFGTSGRLPNQPDAMDFDPDAIKERQKAGAAASSDSFAYATQMARETLINAGPVAAARITHLAQHSTNDRVALDAAKYIMERVLGPVGQKMESPKGAMEQFLEGMFDDAEKLANGGH